MGFKGQEVAARLDTEVVEVDSVENSKSLLAASLDLIMCFVFAGRSLLHTGTGEARAASSLALSAAFSKLSRSSLDGNNLMSSFMTSSVHSVLSSSSVMCAPFLRRLERTNPFAVHISDMRVFEHDKHHNSIG